MSVLAVVAVFLKLLQLMFLESVPIQLWSFAQVGEGFRCRVRYVIQGPALHPETPVLQHPATLCRFRA